MIIIKYTDNFDFEYDIQGLLRSFYPGVPTKTLLSGEGRGVIRDSADCGDNNVIRDNDGNRGNNAIRDIDGNNDKINIDRIEHEENEKIDFIVCADFVDYSKENCRDEMYISIIDDVEKVISYKKNEAKIGSKIDNISETQDNSSINMIVELNISALNENIKSERKILIAKEYSDYNELRKETKNRMKRALYELLSEYTGKELLWGTLSGIRPTKISSAMLAEGMSEQEVYEKLKKDYYISDVKAKTSIEISKYEREILKEIDFKNDYSIYIGIPFCPSTCLYCSFTSNPISRYKKQIDTYIDCVIKELKEVVKMMSPRKIDTLYIGGGTPTTLTAKMLDRLLTAIDENVKVGELKEYTVEAGRPDSIDEGKLRVIKEHGVTRISINPQTLKDETLKIIGRHHTVEQFRQAYKLAREIGFDNINMDFILGLPGETKEDVERNMAEVMELKPDSLTIHSLAVKRAARLNMFRDKYKDYYIHNSEEIMEVTVEAAKKLGLKPYYLYRQKNMAGNLENIGYASEGKAGIYNILIMEEVQDIVACGAGTVTKRVFEDGRIERSDNVKDVGLYIERIDEMIERKRKLFSM